MSQGGSSGGWSCALRSVLDLPRSRRRVVVIAAMSLAGFVTLTPHMAAAENFFDFLFGGSDKPQQQRSSPAQGGLFDPFGNNQPAPQPRAVASGGSGPAYCVRTCDGRYFPLLRTAASPVQMCQAFCPASATKVYFGSNIDTATSPGGERYAESDNAYAYRKALKADCTCNGRDPAGLAPVDLSLDSSLRPGDVVATTDGLVAYTGGRAQANGQTADFTPVASYPGMTPEVRARLNELKVAPVRADMVADDTPPPAPAVETVAPVSPAPKAKSFRDKHAAAN